MTREDYIAALRTLADFYEAHPLLPHPEQHVDELHVNVWVNPDAFPGVIHVIRTAEKVVDEHYFYLRKTVAPGVVIDFFNMREAVCTKVVVGTEKKVEKVATAWEEKEVEREIVEWSCPDSLLSLTPPTKTT